MGRIRVACQTYTWEMLGAGWRGRVTDLLDMIAAAGYEGIEITNTMIREFAAKPEAFAEELGKRGLRLAAFAYASASGFTDPARRTEDIAGAREAIEFVKRFPEPRLGLGGASHPSSRARETLDAAIVIYAEAGRMGSANGVSVNVHPHSHHGSLLESAEEYGYLMERFDPREISLGPDTGHIVRGGQDLLACLRGWMPRITHLHLKDATAGGEWAGLGKGRCDFPAVFRLLEEAGYHGWVVAEEESQEARENGQAAIGKNREYLRSLGY